MNNSNLIIKINRIKWVAPSKGILGKTRSAIMNKMQKEVFISVCYTFGKIFKHPRPVIQKELDTNDCCFIIVDESTREDHEHILKMITEEVWKNIGATQVDTIKRKIKTIFVRKNVADEYKQKSLDILTENKNWVKLNDFLANSLFIYIDIEIKEKQNEKTTTK